MKKDITTIAVLGIILAYLFLALLEDLWFIEAIYFRAMTFQVCMVLIPVLAIAVFITRKHHVASLILRHVLLFVATFFVSAYAIDLLRDVHYGKTQHARLGASYSGTASLVDTLNSLSVSLGCGDLLSAVELSNSQDSSEETVTLSWRAGEKIGDVLAELQNKVKTPLEIDVFGNPGCSGTRFGNIYKITIRKRQDAEPSAAPLPRDPQPGHLEGDR